MSNDRTEERWALLLAVLRARGPTDVGALCRHPTIRESYDPSESVREDLEALYEQGKVVTYSSMQTNAEYIEAWDVRGVERDGWRGRYQRAVEAFEAGKREFSPLSHEADDG